MMAKTSYKSLCTYPSEKISCIKWNTYRQDKTMMSQKCKLVSGYKDHGRVSGVLKYTKHYATMLGALEGRLAQVNRSIIKMNTDRGLLTPLFHRYVLHNNRNGKKYHFHLLYDGLHPTSDPKMGNPPAPYGKEKFV